MAEIKDNDEYEFSEFEAHEPEETEHEKLESDETKRPVHQTNVRRNALIVIGSIIFLMLIYKFISSYMLSSSTEQKTAIITPKPQPVKEVKVETQTVTPVVEPQTPTPSESKISAESSEINQKISSMDLTQQNIRSDLTNMTNQIDAINTNIAALNSKLTVVNQSLTQLVTKVEQQSAQMTTLLVKKVRPRHVAVRRMALPSFIYYIQAVIPGRAWLIATNGSTLTVREGSNIHGYGIVKLIDPNQGRVITSSGKIIRFNQQDS